MISIDGNDATFMLKQLSLPAELENVLKSSKQRVKLSEEQADQLRDFCTDRLDEVGFDKNYEPTNEGKRLESLIDKLFIG